MQYKKLAVLGKSVYIVTMIKIKKDTEGKTMKHSQMLAITKKEEEDRIKDLLEQCGMLCDDIVKLSRRSEREEKSRSRDVYFHAQYQKEKREKEQKELAI